VSRLLALLFGPRDRLVIVEVADALGYRVERIPVVPDTADALVGLIDGGR
jgi:hypothetical protein